ncbi:MAG: hypothetical protein QNJ15_14470 [Erythrobacter sp.]|nr:hypothetical protein [Erythrobacter sp.]
MPSRTRRHFKGLRRASPTLARRFDPGLPISKIDTRPMVFVAILVAIIGLVLARSPQHALTIDLVSKYELYVDGEPIIVPAEVLVSPTQTGQILWNCETIRFAELRPLLNDVIRWPIEPVIVFDPVPDASYDLSVKVLNEIRKAGATKIRFEGLEQHRRFESARTSGGNSSLSVLLSSVSELPEEFHPKAIDQLDCDSN